MLNNEQAMQKMNDILEMQKKRVAAMASQKDFVDYDQLDKLIVGVCGGDGIGPVITKVAEDVLRFLLKDEAAAGKV